MLVYCYSDFQTSQNSSCLKPKYFNQICNSKLSKVYNFASFLLESSMNNQGSVSACREVDRVARASAS